MIRKAVFVDRDGTINQDVHYLSDPEEFRMLPTVAEGIRLLNEHGFLVVIVTNQSGIARGFLTRETLTAIHEQMKSELRVVGARIDAVYYCPHHPDDRCACRKPGTALLEKAILEHDIDPTRSFFMGDRMTDIEAGHRIGCRTILVPEDADLVENEKKVFSTDPDFEGERFLDGVMWILDRASKSQTTKSRKH